MYSTFDMLKAFLSGKSLSIEEQDIAAAITEAKDQALLPFLYLVYERKEFKPFYINAYITQEKFIRLQHELTELFNLHHILHFYVKGSVLYSLYPDMALRTRGDIDVVIEKNNLLLAKEILLNNSFTLLEEDSQHHLGFKKDNLEVELHFTLLDSFDKNYFYFKNVFNFVTAKHEFLGELQKEQHFSYCLCHFAKHLVVGAGIRNILDFYYMLKYWNLDKKKLHISIKAINFERLYSNILNVIYSLTGEMLDDFEVYDIQFFIDYLLHNGIFGYTNLDHGSYFRHNKLRFIISGTFMLDKTYRTTLYPRLGKHWYFYPFCLMHRIIKLGMTKMKKLFCLLFSKNNKHSQTEKEWIKKLGI